MGRQQRQVCLALAAIGSVLLVRTRRRPPTDAERLDFGIAALSGWQRRQCGGELCGRHVPTVSLEEFAASISSPSTGALVEGEQPVVIRDAVGQWGRPELWSNDALEQRRGGVEVKVMEAVEQGGRRPEDPATRSRRMPLAAYLRNVSEATYLFDRSWTIKANPFLADIEIAAPFAPRNGAWAHLTFSLGSPGTGLNFHYHEAAWNAVLRGTKRFLLFPPMAINTSACDRETLSCGGDFRVADAKARQQLVPELQEPRMRSSSMKILLDWLYGPGALRLSTKQWLEKRYPVRRPPHACPPMESRHEPLILAAFLPGSDLSVRFRTRGSSGSGDGTAWRWT